MNDENKKREQYIEDWIDKTKTGETLAKVDSSDSTILAMDGS